MKWRVGDNKLIGQLAEADVIDIAFAQPFADLTSARTVYGRPIDWARYRYGRDNDTIVDRQNTEIQLSRINDRAFVAPLADIYDELARSLTRNNVYSQTVSPEGVRTLTANPAPLSQVRVSQITFNPRTQELSFFARPASGRPERAYAAFRFSPDRMTADINGRGIAPATAPFEHTSPAPLRYVAVDRDRARGPVFVVSAATAAAFRAYLGPSIFAGTQSAEIPDISHLPGRITSETSAEELSQVRTNLDLLTSESSPVKIRPASNVYASTS